MKLLIQVVFFCFSTSIVLGQCNEFNSPLYMADEQNQDWLIRLKSQDKESKWLMIVNRYFQQNDNIENTGYENENVPILIIDGIPLLITDSLSTKSRKQVLTLLTIDKIEKIKVLAKEPESLYVQKPFTGVILVNLIDKKTSRKFQRIKIE